MTKTLTYSSLLLASFLVIAALFVTSKSYSQLAFAAVFYPVFIYVAFQIFPHRSRKHSETTTQKLTKPAYNKVEAVIPQKESTSATESFTVTDIDKRAFLKLVGATGISFFVFSLLGRRADALFLGRGGDYSMQGTNNNQSNNSQPAASPTDGYKISEIDEEGAFAFYGFTDKDGGWLIMREDTDELNYRYAKGRSGFPDNWANRQNLAYDYYHKIS